MRVIQPSFLEFGATILADGGDAITNLEATAAQPLLEARGAILLRGFSPTLADFDAFSRLFPCNFMIHGAPVRKKISPDGFIQTVTEGCDSIVLHSEMHFSPFPPDLLFFYCERAASHGGETNLGDGYAFYERLSEKHKSLLEKKRLEYWNAWSESTWRTYFPSEPREEVLLQMQKLGAEAHFQGNELEFNFKVPAIKKVQGRFCFANGILIHEQYEKNSRLFQTKGDPKKRHGIQLEDGSPIPQALFEEIQELEEQLVFHHTWEKGDVLVVNNSRIMHGREKYEKLIERAIYLKMARWN